VPVFGSEIVEPDRFTFRTVPARAGDLIAHHAYSVHRSAPNRSGRDRVAIGFSYRSSTARDTAA
jgi:ectoine hydroxylase-related dioxygenase (phytanoyl-CoA dioxygenase family)